MKLMTKELEKKFEQFPLYSQDGKGKDAEVVVKYFNPFGVGTWLITEGEKNQTGEWEFFGWANLGYEWECGYVTLRELESLGYIERDLYCGEGKKVCELMEN